MKEPRRLRLFLIITSVVVLFHLFVLVYVKPSFFSFMLPTPHTTGERSPGGALPDAIVYVPIEFDEPAPDRTVTRLIEEPDDEEPPETTDEIPSPMQGAPSIVSSDTGDVGDLGDLAGGALPQGPGVEPVRIPPRPLQITWPDTRKLKHCLGHQIDVQVQVDEDGRILAVEPSASASPPECIRAAVECARQIIFAPGKVNGHPIKMWTEIRIDFRQRRR
jgi:hypothetical protein